MTLEKLLNGVDCERVIGKPDTEITSIATNSAAVAERSIYVCLSGTKTDGHDYAVQSVKYGAVAIVCEREMPVSVPQVIVKNARRALAIISANFYGNAHKRLKIIGVTGTNGKTSTAYIFYSVLNSVGVKCGFIGTLGVFYGGKSLEAQLTTPDPRELHEIFSDMEKDGVKAVVMEVSAHAVYFDKIYGIDFEVSVFTNFTQDHLDFFKTMEEYRMAKLKLFDEYKSKYTVVNIDDKTGKMIYDKHGESITYGIYNPSDVFAMSVAEEKDGVSFVLNLFDCVYEVKSKLSGFFNVYNILAASTAAALCGIAPDLIYEAINKLKTVKGRIEKVYSEDFSVYVDYAHTPDGLKKVLTTLRSVCKGRLICVFGCGGNRDKSKREIMGKISGELADFTVITSDNPRYEEPMEIIFEVERGVISATDKYVLIQDRKEAIKYALSIAKRGDAVLIAGKGSEKFQEILGIKKPFNDKDTVMETLGDRKI